MKKALSVIIFSIVFLTLTGQTTQSKEVLIIGTMHEVPKVLKNAYKPLYKKALSYKPDRIYVETAMPNDSISWHYLKKGYSKFLREFSNLSDSLKTNYTFDYKEFNQALDKDLNKMSNQDLKILIKGFAYMKDAPNFSYYKLIEKYGLEFKRKFRREGQDLTAKLAIALGHKKVFATDDQRTNREFHINWKKCENETEGTEFEKVGKKISKRITRRMIFPSLLGKYGIATNKRENLEDLNLLSGMHYSKGANESCDLAIDFFEQRNQRIVNNLGTQIEKSNSKKSILIIGASHVVGVVEELKKQFPKVKVLTLNELN